MVTAGSNAVSKKAAAPQGANGTGPQQQPLHRVRKVRLQQGMSMRTAARHTGTDVRQLKLQEQETTDLRISDLRKWQHALDVPIGELLVEPESSLSPPVLARARMVRLMKTIAAIQERTQSSRIRRMADTAAEQLVEIMPELKDVSPWHEYGQRRSLTEFGRIVDRQVPEDVLQQPYAPE
jgi:transcriptional regulator with XRE-family HTH domain